MCMETSLYLFNPENDMALAHGKSRFVVRYTVQKMKDDLSFLPAWYAERDGAILVPDVNTAKRYFSACPFGLSVNCVSEVKPIYERIVPWGWNPALCRTLKEKNLPSSAFPDENRMDEIRRLSAWTTAVSLLRLLKDKVHGPLVGTSSVLKDEASVDAFLVRYDRVVLKAPWSGSGRGIQFISSADVEAPQRSWIQRTLNIQQCIVGEPAYLRVVDFAMEFRAEVDGEVHFAGYSLFETDDNGVYKRNLLASDAVIEQRLSAYLSLTVLSEVRFMLEHFLAELLHGAYTGYLGVDMMICREGEAYLLHPCVEMNLRMNMGVVTRILSDRYLDPSSQGFFHIEYYPKPGEALQFHHRMMEQHPLVLSSSKIQHGYLSLTPVSSDTSFQIFIVVE